MTDVCPHGPSPARRRWRHWLACVLIVACATGSVPPRVSAQEASPPDAPIVERVNILQNQFLQMETLLYYISTKPGDRYDDVRIREDFRRLWETGFLDDLLLDVKDSPRGKVVNFVVKERRRIQIVDYRGSKALTTTNIEDALKEKDAQLRIDTFYDPAKARRIESIIKAMLDEKGLRFATVKHEAKNLGAAGIQVSFIVDDGPKAKIKRIEFEGNSVYSDGKLRGRMKKLKQGGFWNLSWLAGKRTFTEEKWGEDQKNIQDYYFDHGYVTAEVGQPKVEYADGKSGFFKKKPVKWITLTIPVTEGDQYRVGEMKFEGLTVLREEAVRPLFKLETGDVYRQSRFKKGLDKLQEIYGSLGYFQFTGYPKRKPDPERKVVDVTLTLEEDKRYYVGRIRFTGNDTTRDKVIRREIYMNEGEVFNTEALKLSIKRVNQLGYFKPMEGAPELGPSPLGDDKIDVTFKVEEQNRNQFTLGGGVSGLEGTFISASFSTANFLGLGETLSLSAQSGARTKNYQIAITEPYFMDRHITAGIDLFRRKITFESFGNFVGYTQEGTGGALTTGLSVGRFSRMFVSYAYEIVDLEGLPPAPGSTIANSGQPIFNPFLFSQDARRRESRVSPSFVMNTTDNPFSPRSGSKYTATVQVAGGILGGTIDYVRPNVEAVWYIPHWRRTALGVRANVAWIKPFGDTRRLPYYQRYFLGGEQQIRGYNIQSVGPFDSFRRSLGGNKSMLMNAEYYFDIFRPLRFLLFLDAGQAYLEGDSFNLKDFRTSTGAEVRFMMPVINVPFRLIYALNPHRDSFQPRSAFKFAVGTTF